MVVVVTANERDLIKGTTKQKLPSPHSNRDGNLLQQDTVRQTTMGAVMEGYVL